MKIILILTIVSFVVASTILIFMKVNQRMSSKKDLNRKDEPKQPKLSSENRTNVKSIHEYIHNEVNNGYDILKEFSFDLLDIWPKDFKNERLEKGKGRGRSYVEYSNFDKEDILNELNLFDKILMMVFDNKDRSYVLSVNYSELKSEQKLSALKDFVNKLHENLGRDSFGYMQFTDEDQEKIKNQEMDWKGRYWKTCIPNIQISVYYGKLELLIDGVLARRIKY